MNNENDCKTPSYSLRKIADWQINIAKGNSTNSNVELPALQRSFVWKVNQIEALWDSVLRGFPTGAFMLSKGESGNLYLLDGQQRATSIALGFYNPWKEKDLQKSLPNSFEDISTLWIDLAPAPSKKTTNQKFVLRVLTKSHPWGYQRVNNAAILSVRHRTEALTVLNDNKAIDNKKGYYKIESVHRFPYDSNLPVPLCFLLEAAADKKEDWIKHVIDMCKAIQGPIKTQHNDWSENYSEQVENALFNSELNIFEAIKNLSDISISAIIVGKEVLEAEDEGEEDPTLFIRLNSSGTTISGEELIYSIYKAAFPSAKTLVESIGAKFIAPSRVISLVTRLVLSEAKEGYPYALGINEFRKEIKEGGFKKQLEEFIGNEKESRAARIFSKAFDIMRTGSDADIPDLRTPAALVKDLIKRSPDVFLLLLKWVSENEYVDVSEETKRRILGTYTSLIWFCNSKDYPKYVKNVWDNFGSQKDFWSTASLSTPLIAAPYFLLSPFVSPHNLREFLKKYVVDDKVEWNELYPKQNHLIYQMFRETLPPEFEEHKLEENIGNIWDNFINRLVWCKPMILYAQRGYINKSFQDFSQMDELEDTNTPWDWDHIYPDSWVKKQHNINGNMRHWNNTIGNFRAISLEDNRSENNKVSPSERLQEEEVCPKSFIKRNDWEHWQMLEGRVNDGDDDVKTHLLAVVNRLCNIYEEWYTSLKIEELFTFKKSG